MNKLITLFFLLLSLHLYGQKVPEKELAEIYAEGVKLFELEMASWVGSDIFVELEQAPRNAVGYFSYADGPKVVCLFYTDEKPSKVACTITFEEDFNPENAEVDLQSRELTAKEKKIHLLRERAISILMKDERVTYVENASLNLIPILDGKESKVYVLTGPKEHGKVLFGNDFMLTFNEKGDLKDFHAFHQNLMVVPAEVEEGAEASVHTHLASSGDLMSPTDVCTLLLYSESVEWNAHMVISDKFITVWTKGQNGLQAIPTKVIEKMKEIEEKEGK